MAGTSKTVLGTLLLLFQSRSRLQDEVSVATRLDLRDGDFDHRDEVGTICASMDLPDLPPDVAFHRLAHTDAAFRFSFAVKRAALLKLGIEVAQSTVAKYMVKRPRRPGRGWTTFLRNHTAGIAATDLFVVPTANGVQLASCGCERRSL